MALYDGKDIIGNKHTDVGISIHNANITSKFIKQNLQEKEKNRKKYVSRF